MDAKERQNVDPTTKLDTIRRVEECEKKSSVTDGFGIPCSTLNTLLRNKADIKVKATEHSRLGACRVRTPAFDKIEKALSAWILDVQKHSRGWPNANKERKVLCSSIS